MRDADNLYAFFKAMRDTAVDIYWGGDLQVDETDCKVLDEADYDAAFDAACAEMAFDEENAEWFLGLPAALAEYYGRHLKIAVAKKTIPGTKESQQ